MHCPVCNTTVAPFDREKVVLRQTEYHGHCFKKLTKSSETNSHVGKQTPKQTYFRFNVAQTVH